jgi:glycosyltransferase involved in cell wall biosynthesis
MKEISQQAQQVRFVGQPSGKPRKTRVLLIVTQLALGGGTKVALDIASYLHKHPGYEVHLLTGPIPADKTDLTHLARDQGIQTRIVPSLVNRISPITNFKAVFDIRRIIVQGRYDIVHTHTKVAGVVGRLAARTARTSTIVHHVHGWGSPEEMSGGKRMLHLGLERLCARFTDRIITVCSLDTQKGLANRIGTKDKFSLIYNGIELDDFRQVVNEQQVRMELGLDPDAKLVGMIGRLEEQKNPLDFIRAAAEVRKHYSKVQFVLVGDGPLRPDCERLIEELGLKEGFFMLGYRDDVARILSILTITAMSSLWEGLPIAFLESMSAGKPIVANDVDGASEVVQDGKTGFLVPPHTPMEMAEKILTLLNDEALCEKMGRIAQERSRRFSIQRMLEEIETLYGELNPPPSLMPVYPQGLINQ